MLKNNSIPICYLSSICITFFVFSTCVHAEIYKWIDANGQIHYSDKKVDAGKSKTEVLKVMPSLNIMPKASSPKLISQDKKQKPLQELTEKETVVDVVKKNERETVDYRCELARRIISGDARLINGLPTGQYEIEVAKRDIRKFCK